MPKPGWGAFKIEQLSLCFPLPIPSLLSLNSNAWHQSLSSTSSHEPSNQFQFQLTHHSSTICKQHPLLSLSSSQLSYIVLTAVLQHPLFLCLTYPQLQQSCPPIYICSRKFESCMGFRRAVPRFLVSQRVFPWLTIWSLLLSSADICFPVTLLAPTTQGGEKHSWKP